MVTNVAEAHVHRRPGGAVAEAECRCPDASAWPIPDDAEFVTDEVSFRVSERFVGEAPEFVTVTPGTLFGSPKKARGPEVRARVAVAVRRLGGVAARRWRAVRWSAVDAMGAVRWRLARALRWLWRGLRAEAGTAAAVASALVMSLGGAAQVAGVGVGTWAAWEVDATAGRLVLAVGLLFLGGAVGRVVREVRNGSTR